MRKILVKMLLIGKATRRTSTFLKVYLERRVRVLFVSYVYRGERIYEIKFMTILASWTYFIGARSSNISQIDIGKIVAKN